MLYTICILDRKPFENEKTLISQIYPELKKLAKDRVISLHEADNETNDVDLIVIFNKTNERYICLAH